MISFFPLEDFVNMSLDDSNQNEQMTSVNALIYAVDDYGIRRN
jgi:hypothetical protein